MPNCASNLLQFIICTTDDALQTISNNHILVLGNEQVQKELWKKLKKHIDFWLIENINSKGALAGEELFRKSLVLAGDSIRIGCYVKRIWVFSLYPTLFRRSIKAPYESWKTMNDMFKENCWKWYGASLPFKKDDHW